VIAQGHSATGIEDCLGQCARPGVFPHEQRCRRVGLKLRSDECDVVFIEQAFDLRGNIKEGRRQFVRFAVKLNKGDVALGILDHEHEIDDRDDTKIDQPLDFRSNLALEVIAGKFNDEVLNRANCHNARSLRRGNAQTIPAQALIDGSDLQQGAFVRYGQAMKKVIITTASLAGVAATAFLLDRARRRRAVGEAVGSWADAVSEQAVSSASSVSDLAEKAAAVVSQAAESLPEEAGDLKAKASEVAQRAADAASQTADAAAQLTVDSVSEIAQAAEDAAKAQAASVDDTPTGPIETKPAKKAAAKKTTPKESE